MRRHVYALGLGLIGVLLGAIGLAFLLPHLVKRRWVTSNG